jgi:hypothetical protein
LATLQSSTDPAVDLVVGLGVPLLDLTVPLVQLASSIAITAAVTRAGRRRVGRMTAVCHRLTPLPGPHATLAGPTFEAWLTTQPDSGNAA